MELTRAEILERIRDHWQWPFDFDDSCVALLQIGSHAHGTYIPPSDPNGIDDTDVMAIVIPPPRHVYGLLKFEHTQVKAGALDCVVYSWDKYIRLLLKSNPNVLGTLWMDLDRQYLREQEWKNLRNARWSCFSSKLAYDAFVGYAKGQFHRMTHNAHQGYMGEKRKALVAQFGYDVKNAAHLIRLLRMAVEFLQTGSMRVYRDYDAEELKSIKSGGYKLEQIKKHAEDLFKQVDYALADSTLPEKPSHELAEGLLLNGYHTWWKRKGF